MPLLPKKANTEGNSEGLGDRTPVPPGTYTAHIVKTEFKATKAKTGHYLAVQHKVIGGDHEGRVLFTNLNLDNPNPVAVEIANKELNSMCAACGLQGVEDSDELLNIPHQITVKIEPATANYPAGNSITGYEVGEGTVVEEEVEVEAPEEVAEEVENTAEEAPKKLPWE